MVHQEELVLKAMSWGEAGAPGLIIYQQCVEFTPHVPSLVSVKLTNSQTH